MLCTLALLPAAMLLRGPFPVRLAIGAVLAANPLAVRAAWFGTADAPAVLVLVLAFACAQRRRYTGALALVGVAVILKQFAIVAAPFLLLEAWRDGGRRRSCGRSRRWRGRGRRPVAAVRGRRPGRVLGRHHHVRRLDLPRDRLRPRRDPGQRGRRRPHRLLPVPADRARDLAAGDRRAALAPAPGPGARGSPAAGFAASMFVLVFIARVFQTSYLIYPLAGLCVAAVAAAGGRARHRPTCSRTASPPATDVSARVVRACARGRDLAFGHDHDPGAAARRHRPRRHQDPGGRARRPERGPRQRADADAAQGGPPAVAVAMAETLRAAVASAGASPGQLLAVGVGAPGAVDFGRPATSRTPGTSPAGGARSRSASTLSADLGVPVRIGNDVDVATEAEYRLGAGKGYRSVLGVFWGTGVGGGLILNGQRWTGRGAAAEIGHVVVVSSTGCRAGAAGAAAWRPTPAAGRWRRGPACGSAKGHHTTLFDIMERRGQGPPVERRLARGAGRGRRGRDPPDQRGDGRAGRRRRVRQQPARRRRDHPRRRARDPLRAARSPTVWPTRCCRTCSCRTARRRCLVAALGDLGGAIGAALSAPVRGR